MKQIKKHKTMINIFSLIFLFLLVGCEQDSSPTILFKIENDCSGKEEVFAKYVVECAKAANPLSDEEGEDLVLQCERTMRRALCQTKETTVEMIDNKCYNKSNIQVSCEGFYYGLKYV